MGNPITAALVAATPPQAQAPLAGPHTYNIITAIGDSSKNAFTVVGTVDGGPQLTVVLPLDALAALPDQATLQTTIANALYTANQQQPVPPPQPFNVQLASFTQ